MSDFKLNNLYQSQDKKTDYIQKVELGDYSYTWWPQGWQGAQRDVYSCTGSYGMAIDTQKGYISRLGAFPEVMGATQKLEHGNSDIESLDACSMDYAVAMDGVQLQYKGIDPAEPFNSTEYRQLDYFGVSNRILESGRYMQRIDLMYLTFENSNLQGRMEVNCNPDFFGISFELFSEELKENTEIEFSLKLKETYNRHTFSADGRALTVTNGEGVGFTFYAPDKNVDISVENSTVMMTGKNITLNADTFSGFGVLVKPSCNAQITDADKLIALENINIIAQQIMPNNEVMQEVSYDKARGYHKVSQNGMFCAQGKDFNEDNINTYDWLRLTIENPSDVSVRVPLQFFKDGPFSVTGMCPMLRDSVTGEPIGVPVQLTKNWHSHIYEKSPRRYLEGVWYRGYTVLEVPAHSNITYDYTCTFATWGGVYAASHSQLCLAGWGGGQQWETSAIGSFGESFCYDIGRSWTRCVMGDICPLALYSRVDGGKYNWTSNIGGGDFLFYSKDKGPDRISFKRIKTFFRKQGPNLSEVIYRGLTEDDAVEVEIKVYLPRTNDVSHAIQQFKYTFLKDVEFERMALYQNGSDSYNYAYWTRMAVGNKDGLQSFEVEGKIYENEFPVPYQNDRDAYLGYGDMNRLELGDGLWTAWLGGRRKGSFGNKLMAVHSYNAEINGKKYTSPALSIRTSYVLSAQGAFFELNPPAEIGKIIKRGSVIECTLDYTNLPIEKEEYYGGNEAITGFDGELDSWKFAYMYAMQSKTKVTATLGKVISELPVTVQAEGDKGAQFTVFNGIGYVPVTVTGLNRYDGWALEVKNADKWERIDQSVYGNDFWQCLYDAEKEGYELTFNVPHNGKKDIKEYRLIRK